MVILGKQAIDDDCNQTGQILSSLLDCHQATFASKVEVNDDKTINVTREVDGGLETIKISIPCVITTDLRLNEPRYASLPNIMKAKQKKIDILDINDLNIDIKRRVETIEVNEPPERKPGVIVNDVDSLIDKLKNEANVI
jgi:electron transfer flavoprotein beta subunit